VLKYVAADRRPRFGGEIVPPEYWQNNEETKASKGMDGGKSVCASVLATLEGPPSAPRRSSPFHSVSEPPSEPVSGSQVEVLSETDPHVESFGKELFKAIFHFKTEINTRIDESVNSLEKRTCCPLDKDPGILKNVHKVQRRYPVGLGYFLCNDFNYSKTSEPELSVIYDAIMGLKDDDETQDKLLCFLDDYKLRQKELENLDHQRKRLIRGVLRWFRKDPTAEITKNSEEIPAIMSMGLSFHETMKDYYLTAVHAVQQLAVTSDFYRTQSRQRGKSDKMISLLFHKYTNIIL
jgi:hypothetical protein